MEEVRRIMAELDWSPLWISMKTGVIATVISFFLGIYAARKSGGTETKSGSGWYTDTSYGTSSHGCRFFPAAHIQCAAAVWGISIWQF